MTPQRQLILEAIESMAGHIAVEAVHARVVERFPQVNISTVYRTLDLLQELGLVTHTHFDDGIAQYHRADQGLHQHLVCRGCGLEQELGLSILAPLADELRRRHGFELDLHHFALVGQCRVCVARGTTEAPHRHAQTRQS
jgi:Fur family ferric uptake transcriptional regulator